MKITFKYGLPHLVYGENMKPNQSEFQETQKYDLSHLTQSESQEVLGPIQDDEALLMFAIIRTMRIHVVVEIGGYRGYSASNFSKALVDGRIYTVDIHDCPRVAENHIFIQKDCRLITPDDIPEKIDMIFFDAHVYEEQLAFYETLKSNGMIGEDVVLCLHDTNLHPTKLVEWSYYLEDEKGWCHQQVERRLVSYFKTQGFDAINFHTRLDEHTIKYRHGITVMKKYRELGI